MRRLSPVLLLGLSLGCAGQATVSPAPAPAGEVAIEPAQAERPEAQRADPSPAAVLPAVPVPPTVDSSSVSELAQELRQEADSALDEQALDALENAEANAPSDPVAAEGEDLPVRWDLDVVRWNEHERVQYWIRYFQGPAQERFQIWLDRMPRYEPMIRGNLQAANMPTDLVYLALIESGFSNTAVSRARATGMWQFMRATGKEYGLRIDSWVDERRDPVKATGAALRHLSDLYDRFGSYYLAAAAYNAGGGKISRGLRRIGMSADNDLDDDEMEDARDADFFRLRDTRHIRQETKDYVPKLIAAALVAKEPARYGFSKTEPLPPAFPMDSLIVPGMTGLDVVAGLADTSLAAMRDLNPHFLRSVTPPGSVSVVRLPGGTMDAVAAAFAALPAEERTSFRYHKTRAGDTPAKVAAEYNVSVAAVLEANPGTRNGTLKAGQQLVVPMGGEASVLVARQVATYRDGVDGSGQVRYHTVRSGETLGGIARKYRVSVASLKEWNGLRSNTIRTGQRLRVYGGRTTTVAVKRAPAQGGGALPPGTSTVRHKVQRGETLSGIAQHYGVTVSSIRQANDLAGGLKAGTTIRIPRKT